MSKEEIKEINALRHKIYKVEDKSNLNNAYLNLEKAFAKNDSESMCNSLKVITKYPLRKRDFVFQCLYKLTRNGYYKDVEQMLPNIKLVLKSEKIYMFTLRNAIQNNEKLANLSDVKRGDYYFTLHYGKMYDKKYDYANSFFWYKRGYEITKQPIFLYYLGKESYKLKNFKEAEDYFHEYIQVGDTKLEKAYFYLAGIANMKQDLKSMKRYYGIVEQLWILKLIKSIFMEQIKEDLASYDYDKKKARIERGYFRKMRNKNALIEDYGWLGLEEEGTLKK